jgi:hypothetical protein
MLVEIGRWVLLGICQIIAVVFAALLLVFTVGGLYATLREVLNGKVGILLISFWFAAGLCGFYKAFLAEWNFFSYAVVAIAATACFHLYMQAKIDKAINVGLEPQQDVE